MKLLRSRSSLICILLIALILRLINLNQSLWLDEAIGALAARNLTSLDIVKEFMLFDNHPPLYYLILDVWTKFFGYSEVVIRLPSVIFGVLTVYLTFLISEKIGGKNNFFSLFSTLLITTSQFHIYYSQEARMYAATAFFACLAFYSLLNTFEEKSKINWIIFSFAETALIFIDYVPIFFLPVIVIVAYLKKPGKKWWGVFLITQIPLLLLGIMWLPTLIAQVEKGKWLVTTWPEWKQVAGGADIKQLALIWTKFAVGRISPSNRFFYYLLIGVVSIPIAYSLLIASLRRAVKVKFIILWLVLPLVLGFCASFWFPAFIYFRFVYLIPAFYILISWGVSSVKQNSGRYLIALSILGVNFLSTGIYTFDENQQREHWRQATGFVEGKAGEEDIIIFEFPEPFAPYKWYSEGKVDAMGVTDSISANVTETSVITNEAVKNKQGVYYFEYLRELSDPDDTVRKTLKNLGFTESELFNYPGVGFIYYWIR